MLSRRLLRIKVIKALYAHFKSEGDSLIVSEKNLHFGVDKAYQLYHLFLALALEVHRYAEKRIEQGKNKMLPSDADLHPNLKFITNRAIEKIAASDELLDYLASHKLGWVNHPELAKKIYLNMTGKEYYREYMESGQDSFAEDVRFLIDFYVNELEDFEYLEQVVEEESIYWADDIGFALVLVVKTLQSLRESDPAVKPLPKFKNDDDRRFASDLFRAALVNHTDYFARIDAHTRNWDLERIAYMDRIIMLAMIAELLHCPTIPVKVTLDEFIEISKYYSTTASGTFINGVLDKIIHSLREEGKLVKEGRGLMEN